MPQGLQVFDENGNVTLDVTDRLTRYLGVIEMSDLSDRGSVDIGEGEPWVYIEWEEYNVHYLFPHVRMSGTKIYYGYEKPGYFGIDGPTEPMPCKIYYGAY